jgi:hypothetical protein
MAMNVPFLTATTAMSMGEYGPAPIPAGPAYLQQVQGGGIALLAKPDRVPSTTNGELGS